MLARIRELWLRTADRQPWPVFLEHLGCVLAAHGEGLTPAVLDSELARRTVRFFRALLLADIPWPLILGACRSFPTEKCGKSCCQD